ncbi:cytochrome P450 [Podospora aff. communis PSN243]|uniref:Cytochrome P450 n=1 Tax=Podospora aff. communis PSN243 TaxID=3040156 RepID=A0AAV9FXJ2_9PEZI|nr:cytochrome P450 [Podospora aff. communis PSN243]
MLFSLSPTTVFSLFFSVVIITLLVSKLRRGPGPPEPPTVHVPLLSILRHGSQLLEHLAVQNLDSTPHGIFTASFFFGLFKAYVVTSPEVTLQIQSRSSARDFSFVPFFFLTNMGGTRGDSFGKLIGDDGGVTFKGDFHDAHVTNLTLGVKHDGLMDQVVQAASVFVERLQAEVGTEGKNLDIWLWLKEAGAVSVGRAIWGPRSPYSVNEGLWEDLWTFVRWYEPMKCTIAGVVPWASEGTKARDRVTAAFYQFALEGSASMSSPLAQSREKCFMNRGLNDAELAACAISMSVGQIQLVSLVYSAIARITQYPGLLDRIRQEIDAQGEESDFTQTAGKCPLLLSAVHETLRLGSLGVTIRNVLADHEITMKGDGTTYQLRKGGMVWASGRAIHGSPVVHRDPECFVPGRFLAYRFPETQIPEAFRTFSGGGNICLGRHVARDAATCLVAIMLMRFDYTPAEAGGLNIPDLSTFAFQQGISHPTGNTTVNVRARRG